MITSATSSLDFQETSLKSKKLGSKTLDTTMFFMILITQKVPFYGAIIDHVSVVYVVETLVYVILRTMQLSDSAVFFFVTYMTDY
jgi:hypothetical protein